MSPLLTAVPAPVPTWVQEGYFPSFGKADTDLVALNTDRWAWHGYLNDPATGTPMLVSGPTAGGGGALSRHELALGVPFALRYSTTGAILGDTWRLPMIPAALNPFATAGHLIGREDWRVSWLRVPISDVGGTGDASCGHMWSWDVGGVAAVHWAQAGDLFQQHGVCGDGAGGIQYRSYSAAAALLETVALPGYTAGVWNTLDHVFISGAPGRAPQYNLYLNGVLTIARNFGTGVLPYVVQPRLQLVTRATNVGAVLYFAYMHLRLGRFGPDGREYLS